MAYSDFTTLDSALRAFGLAEKSAVLFDEVPPLAMSDWLRDTLRRAIKVALSSGNEKARSEFIVAPILLEIASRNENRVALHSGKYLNVDTARGLNGECDFFLARSQQSYTIQAPICTLVEAKKADIELGLGQCVAQMLGAQIFNEQNGYPAHHIFGCVTTGEDWQFLKLEGPSVFFHRQHFYLETVERILGILQSIVDSDEDSPGQTP